MSGYSGRKRFSQAAALREQNTSRILSILLKHPYVSRREIITDTGFAASTVSGITGELLERGLVHRVGNFGARGPGRKAELLSRNPGAGVVATAHITPDIVRVAIVDFGYNLIASRHVHYPHGFDERNVSQVIAELRCLVDASVNRTALVGVGLALPNDPFDNGQIIRSFAESFDAPVMSINNVEAMAVCEYYFHLSQTLRTFLFVYVGTGIGSGFIINGELYRGVTGKASDFGHTYITDEDVLCRCGRHGCLEAVASEHAIRRELQAHGADPAALTRDALVSTVAQRIQQEDDVTVGLIQRAASYLGKGIFNLVSVLDPQAVVVTGRINALNPYFSNLVERAYIDQFGKSVFAGVPLHFVPLRDDAAVTGTAMFCFRSLYCDSSSRAAVQSKPHS